MLAIFPVLCTLYIFYTYQFVPLSALYLFAPPPALLPSGNH